MLMRIYLIKKGIHCLPIMSVEHEEKPDDLLNYCQEEKRKKDEPEDEVNPFIENINRKNAESIIVHDRTTWTIQLQCALGHLWKNIIKGIAPSRIDGLYLISND